MSDVSLAVLNIVNAFGTAGLSSYQGRIKVPLKLLLQAEIKQVNFKSHIPADISAISQLKLTSGTNNENKIEHGKHEGRRIFLKTLCKMLHPSTFSLRIWNFSTFFFPSVSINLPWPTNY